MSFGVSDGGAHTKFATSGRYPTEFLIRFVREHQLCDLETAHWRLAALPAVDLAIVVVDPDASRATLAEPFLRRIDELGIPHVIFINKIDGARAGSVSEVLDALQPMSREPLALRLAVAQFGELRIAFLGHGQRPGNQRDAGARGDPEAGGR